MGILCLQGRNGSQAALYPHVGAPSTSSPTASSQQLASPPSAPLYPDIDQAAYSMALPSMQVTHLKPFFGEQIFLLNQDINWRWGNASWESSVAAKCEIRTPLKWQCSRIGWSLGGGNGYTISLGLVLAVFTNLKSNFEHCFRWA